MCGRYTIRRIDLFIRHGAMDVPLFDAFDEKRFVPRFNVAPSQHVPIIRMDGTSPVGELAKWGFIPAWTRDRPKLQPINARAETLATSGMFKRAFDRHRCLIPADGFYEWQGVKPPKTPYFIRMKADQPFMFAGLWERWTPEGAEPIDTCAIITTTANELMQPIHNRMPVIVAKEDQSRWLDTGRSGPDVQKLLRPFDAGEMEAYAIGTKVNNVRNDGPELVDKL